MPVELPEIMRSLQGDLAKEHLRHEVRKLIIRTEAQQKFGELAARIVEPKPQERIKRRKI